ncbi:hypothetical protein L1987_17929 [Smallanthus sonchifolius]|uniref:Uncharacterized protein n=1 Tax=Smallanthus sonchifolius TaxID=185202 RepID=A0ACB9J0H8_9ASTR|nr:hypothetical protein L1987_17929 [Smallanthus sonchifolius]
MGDSRPTPANILSATHPFSTSFSSAKERSEKERVRLVHLLLMMVMGKPSQPNARSPLARHRHDRPSPPSLVVSFAEP